MTHRLLTVSLLLSAAAPAQSTGSVSGIVVNDAGRQPVRKAAVTLVSMARDRSYAVAVTDGSGRFTIPALPAGRYRLGATRNGFFSIGYGATKPGENGAALVLAKGETRAGITLHLLPVRAVSGTVADAEGDPAPGIEVSLYLRRFDRGKPRYFQGETTITNQRGEYQFAGVTPGQYYAMAEGRSTAAVRSRPVVVLGEKPLHEMITRQFYPRSASLAGAAPILVDAGHDTTGIDFQLSSAPPVSVHGRITGLAEKTSQVNLYIRSGDSPDPRSSIVNLNLKPEDPVFQMQGLTPGTYQIVANSTSPSGQRRVVETVQLVSPDTEVSVALAPGIDLPGAVQVEGPGAEKVEEMRVSLSSGDYVPMRSRLQATVEAGNFTLRDVPAGIWDINVAPIPAGAYIKSMTLGRQDVLAEDMLITAASKGPLKIVISTAAPRVEGTVTPAGPATILIAPTGKFADVFSFFSTARADEKGRFQAAGLNPGTYRIYAFHQIEPESWQDPAFLRPFEAQSQALDLKEGALEKVTLAVIGDPAT
ncbi:MAG: carboxypeptidase regulatory-like domain-containing protein [Acidobacteriota bacterium]|nr:carboxypeptidase regulatory-like domain-containing protein [Acidobacteriota bacterium]